MQLDSSKQQLCGMVKLVFGDAVPIFQSIVSHVIADHFIFNILDP